MLQVNSMKTQFTQMADYQRSSESDSPLSKSPESEYESYHIYYDPLTELRSAVLHKKFILSLRHYTCESYPLAVQWMSDVSLVHLDLHKDI